MAIAQLRTFSRPPRPAPGPWKAADVERFPDDGYQYEIWRGELVRMAPAGGRHGECEAKLVIALGVQVSHLGRVYTGDTGFLLHQGPDELVSPDVAFVRHDRLPPPAERTRYLRVVPDLVVEIRSPTDAEADVRTKVSLYIRCGVRLVWLVDPHERTIEEVRPGGGGGSDGSALTHLLRADADAWIEASDVLPGFRLPAQEVFE